MERGKSKSSKPRIEAIAPRAAICGGEIAIQGQGFVANGNKGPVVRFGEQAGSVLISSQNRLVVRIPEGAASGDVTVDADGRVSEPVSIVVGLTITENLHPVANPAIDAAGNIFSTFSGSRGQKVPVSVFKVARDHTVQPFLSSLMNPTGLAFDRDGLLYISSRAEGTIYQATPDGQRSVYAEGMGVATGMAFDHDGNLYVGDRTGTIFKINPARQIFVFATMEPSVAAYHLAFGADNHLYATGPTTSSFDHVYRISPAGQVTSFYRGLGRPQGLAFDAQGNLYVAASLGGHRGIVRLAGQSPPELVVSGNGIVGLAFTPHRSMIVATNSSLIELFVDIEGRPLPQ
ncbi:MAG: IPT/TIG domain-containing protein [Acidobacteriia bacterium]|nr:IPT/TIG domain-containing protein [Terriglobia bacterium]